jgi:hypothetical protein
MMNGSTSKIHSENPPNSLPKGAKSRFYLPIPPKSGIIILPANLPAKKDGAKIHEE